MHNSSGGLVVDRGGRSRFTDREGVRLVFTAANAFAHGLKRALVACKGYTHLSRVVCFVVFPHWL